MNFALGPTAFQDTLYVLFNAGVPSHQACGVILHTFPFMTCNDVDAWYRYFVGNNIHVQEPIPHQEVENRAQEEGADGVEEPEKTFSDLPVIVLDNITKNLSATDTKALKIVSSHSLKYVNTSKVYFLIHLHLDADKARVLTFGAESKSTCDTFSKGKRNHADEKRKGLHAFVDEAVKRLMQTFRQPGVKIKTFRITSDILTNDETLKNYGKKVQRKIFQLKELINVEHFEIDSRLQISILDFLKRLKPGTLSMVDSRFDTVTTDLKEIASLPHWSHLKDFDIGTALNFPFHSLSNLRTARVMIPTITPEEVADLKKSLVETQHFYYSYTFGITNGYLLADCLKQLEPYVEQMSVKGEQEKGYFINNNQQRCYFRLAHNAIQFSIVRLDF